MTGRWKSLRLIRKIASQNSGDRIVWHILQKQKKKEYVFWEKACNKSKKCIIDLVYITDKYIHKELKLDYTRKALELISRYDLGVTLMIQKLDFPELLGPYTKVIGLSENFCKFSPNALKLLKPTFTILAPRCIFCLPWLYYSLFLALLNIARIKRYTLQRLSTIDIIIKIVFRYNL